MEAAMLTTEESGMANTRRESSEARVERRLEGNDADWNADYVRRDHQREIALAQKWMGMRTIAASAPIQLPQGQF
jgi:hypothetical protein